MINIFWSGRGKNNKIRRLIRNKFLVGYFLRKNQTILIKMDNKMIDKTLSNN